MESSTHEGRLNQQQQEQGTHRDMNNAHHNEPPPQPTVLHPTTLPDFITHILATHAAPTTLVICGPKDAFLAQLLEAIRAADAEHETASESDMTARSPHYLLKPTLHLLATSRTVTVAVCPSLENLRAYLSAYPARRAAPEPDAQQAKDLEARAVFRRKPVPMLAVFNLVALHRETTSFSAQGLSRTVAAAVEAATGAGQRLIFAECGGFKVPRVAGDEGLEDAGDEGGAGGADGELGERDERGGQRGPWEEEISILNVTTKSFGAGERGWVGRTVSVRRVFEQWCTFQSL